MYEIENHLSCILYIIDDFGIDCFMSMMTFCRNQQGL